MTLLRRMFGLCFAAICCIAMPLAALAAGSHQPFDGPPNPELIPFETASALLISFLAFLIMSIFILRRLSLALTALAAMALALAGCQADGADWGKIAAGTALVLEGSGQTVKIDPRVAQVSSELARYCPMLQIAAAIGTSATSGTKRVVGLQASAALKEVCADLPADVPAAVVVAERAVTAARNAGLPTSPS